MSTKRAFQKIVSLGAFAAAVCTYSSSAELKQNKRVLLLAEMGMSSPVVFVVTQEITSALQASPRNSIDFYFESLDTNLFSDRDSQTRIENWLVQKYADRKPDVIIAGGPTPLQFLASSQRFFPDVPVVFVGSFKEQAKLLDLTSRFTGVWLENYPDKTLEVAVRLKPDTRNVFVVGGVSPLDRFVESIVRDGLRTYEDKYRITYLTDLAMPALLERLRQLPEHSIVVFSVLFLDAAGQRFIPEAQALPLISQASNAPVFQLIDVGLGSGVVGGYVSSFAGQGRTAAEDVLKILDGVRPDEIPEVNGTAQYMFDWRAIERWDFDKRSLPAGSMVLFREPTLWERYKPQIVATLLVILALTVLSIYLAFETRRRRRAETATAASLRFEQIISELSARFIELPADRIDSGITEAMDRLVQVLGIDRLTVFKFSSEGNKLVAVYVSKAREASAPPAELSIDGCEWYVSKLRRRESVVVNRLNDLPTNASDVKRLCELHGVRATVAVPIEVEGLVFGCLSFVQTSRETIWTDQLVTQFRMVGQVIANALARKQADERQQELSGLLINAGEAERTRLARELHDDFSQRIAVLAIDLERMPKKMGDIPVEVRNRLSDLWSLATGIGSDLHSLSHRLHSSTLDSLGLVDALESLCEEFTTQNETGVSFVPEQVPGDLPPDVALCLFRVVQEALRNVKKHSHASGVAVRISGTQDGLVLSIADDGVGFDVNDSAKRVGLGLRSMQERVRLVGGSLLMHSGAELGTRINIRIPLHPEAEQHRPQCEDDLEKHVGG